MLTTIVSQGKSNSRVRTARTPTTTSRTMEPTNLKEHTVKTMATTQVELWAYCPRTR